MTMKLFRVVVRGPGGDRTIRVPSPTTVQAGDAAAFVDRGALPALSHELRAAFEANLARQEANR